jgi:hypothetical protein
MQPAHALDDFVDFLRVLEEEGIPFAVIGGCAVGAYARLRGGSVFSEDLDIYVSEASLEELLLAIEAKGGSIRKRPQPRAVPVAVIDWKGREINVITSSAGLAEPDVVIRSARQFELAAHGLTIPVAEPYDLLANKLAVRRDKDLPHIALLERFVEEELVTTFCGSANARDRLEPARRYMTILGRSTLPAHLGDDLVACADQPALRRFLVNHLAGREQVERVVAVAPESERTLLAGILSRRTFE